MPTSPQPPATFFIEVDKITLYLLNADHPDGRSKAKFFMGWGFASIRPQELATALLHHPSTALLVAGDSDKWGTKFIYEGPLSSPNGATPSVRSIWEVRTGDSSGRLVTAYPC